MSKEPETKHYYHKSLITLKKTSFIYKLYYFLISFKLFYDHKTFIKYMALGIVGTIIDFGLLYVLTEYLGIFYLVSGIVSMGFGLTVNYFLNKKYTFKYSPKSKSKGITIYTVYIIVASTSVFFTTGLLVFFVEVFFMNYMIAKAIASLLMLLYRFIGHKLLFDFAEQFEF